MNNFIILSLQASAPATSKGDPLYAELEHKKRKPIIMTGVQYSEIKTDEVRMINHYLIADEFCR